MQVSIEANKLCLTCSMVPILSGTMSGSRLTYLMSEEMKTLDIEAASSFHGNIHSSFHPPWRKSYCHWLIEDSFPGFVSGNSVVALPSKKLCCLIVQELSSNLKNLLWRAEPTGHMVDSIKKVGCQHVGALLSLGQPLRWHNRCFLVSSAHKGTFW